MKLYALLSTDDAIWRQIEYCFLLRMTPLGVIWMSWAVTAIFKKKPLIFLLNKDIYKKLACIFSPRLSSKKLTLWPPVDKVLTLNNAYVLIVETLAT